MNNPTEKLQAMLDGFGNKNNGRIEKRSDGFYYTKTGFTTFLDQDYFCAIAILKLLFI